LVRHGQLRGVGVVTEGFENLVQLFRWVKGQIEEEDFFAPQHAAAAPGAAEIFLTDLVSQTRSQIKAVFQHFHRVHPSFSKSPTSVPVRDYNVFIYSCPAEFDDTVN
jgi:hypothetical protein